jgi:hypothetical protein
VTSWTPNLWKVSLYHTTLTEAACHFSPPASYQAVCMNLQNEQVSITHHAWLPYPPPGNIIQHSPWTDWISPNTTEKHKQWTVIQHQQWRWVWKLNLPQRMGVSQEADISVPNSQWMKSNKGWKWGKGQQANHPEELLTLSRGWERHKGWEQGKGSKPTSRSEAGGRSWSWSHGTEGSIQNWIAPPCWGRRWPELEL